jgi:hypothetical protein
LNIYEACVPDRMHHIDLGLFKYQVDYTQDILKKVGGTELQKKFDERLRQIPRFPGLKLLSKLGQLKILTAADYRNVMKIIIFALDEIFDEWEQIVTCNELCELYAKFSKMYLMSRQESFTGSDLKNFEVINNKLKLVKFRNINKFSFQSNRKQLLIGVRNLKGYSLHYLQRNVVFLNYTAGGITQVSIKSNYSQKSQITILHLTATFFFSCRHL